MKTKVIIKTQFTALHCWPDCPIPAVSFLRNSHRHVFHVTMKFAVTHNDRDIEFLQKKSEIEAFVQRYYHNMDLGRTSCEDIAEALITAFNAVYCSVFEDNENGAEIEI